MMKVRKTYVVSYLDDNAFIKQNYFQSYNEARHNEAELRRQGRKHTYTSYFIDGAELLRLARLGYDYDPKRKQAVKMKHYQRKFIQVVDNMPQERRDQLFLDYRNFKTSDDVIVFQQRNRR